MIFFYEIHLTIQLPSNITYVSMFALSSPYLFMPIHYLLMLLEKNIIS
jgi:hypothetical protein